MSAPTAKELELLSEFREMVADLNLTTEDSTDLALLRWIRAREWDLSKANDMLRTSVKWKRENGIDKILEWYPPTNYLIEYDYDIEGRDSEGRPVIVLPFGQWDVKKSVSKSAEDMETWLRYLDQMFGRVMQKMKEAQGYGEVTQFILIADVKNLAMKQIASFTNLESFKEIVRRLESNYPETVYKVYVVNASRVFSILFSCIKPFLTARTVAKIGIYSAAKKWMPLLLEAIPKNQLPVAYGGIRRREFLKHLNGVSNEFDKIQIGAGQKIELKYTVVDPNSKLVWKFHPETYDIGFYINYNNEENVIPYHRYESSSNGSIESNSFLCKNTGDYLFIFDNSYSKLRGKTVYYSIDIILQDGEEN